MKRDGFSKLLFAIAKIVNVVRKKEVNASKRLAKSCEKRLPGIFESRRRKYSCFLSSDGLRESSRKKNISASKPIINLLTLPVMEGVERADFRQRARALDHHFIFQALDELEKDSPKAREWPTKLKFIWELRVEHEKEFSGFAEIRKAFSVVSRDIGALLKVRFELDFFSKKRFFSGAESFDGRLFDGKANPEPF
jgi:hypothetical protein